jgi:hypothetical protein
VSPKENQLCRVAKDVQEAGQRQHRVEIEEKPGGRNEKHRRAEAGNRSDNLGKECDKKELEDEHGVPLPNVELAS